MIDVVFVDALDVDECLRQLWDLRGEVGQGALGVGHALHQVQGSLHTVTGGAVVEHEHVAGLLPAERVPVGDHPFEHVAVADGGLHGLDAVLLHRLCQPQVRHDGCDEGVPAQLAELLEPDGQDAHDLVAVDDASQGVHGQAAVGVAVECHAQVGLGFDDEALQRFEVGRSDTVVDVEAVGFGGGDDDFGTGLTQCGGSDDGGGTVGAVDDDLESGQRAHVLSIDAAHEVFGVLIGGGRVAGDATDGRAGGAVPILVEDFEDLVFDGVVELRSACGEELDAVVGHGVVGGGDDDAEGGTRVLDDLSDARGRQHSRVEDVDSGGGDAGAQCG